MSDFTSASTEYMKRQIFKIQEVLIMQNKLFLKAADICELLEVKQTFHKDLKNGRT